MIGRLRPSSEMIEVAIGAVTAHVLPNRKGLVTREKLDPEPDGRTLPANPFEIDTRNFLHISALQPSDCVPQVNPEPIQIQWGMPRKTSC